MQFSDMTLPLVMDWATVDKAVAHLSQRDPKLAALIAWVGADTLASDSGTPRALTQARLFDHCICAITFTMISVDAGNSFLQHLATKIGVCIQQKKESKKGFTQPKELLQSIYDAIHDLGDNRNIQSPNHLLELLIQGHHNELAFTVKMLQALVDDCEIIKKKCTAYLHVHVSLC